MVYFLFLPAALALFILFLALTLVEGKTGSRLFGASRDRFDERVARASFVLQHVDWGAFVNDVLRTSLERALHDMAHGMLLAVRFIERGLTRAVRYLRMRRERLLPATAEQKPLLEQTTSYLKRTLRRTRRAPENLPGQNPEDVVEL